MKASNLATTCAPSPVAEALSLRSTTFFVVGLISLIINILMLSGPLFMLQIYDRVLTSRSVPTLVVLSGLVGGLYLFFGLLDGIRSRSLTRVAAWLDSRLSAQSLRANVMLSLRVSGRWKEHDSVRDLDAVRQFLSGPGPSALFDVPWMPAYLALIFFFHSYLGWLAFGGAVLIILLIGMNEMASRGPARAVSSFVGQRTAMVSATRRNAEVLCAMGMLETFTRRWKVNNAEFLKVQRQAIDRGAYFSTSIKVLRFLLQSAVLGAGAWLVLQQEISPGVMIAASIITSRALAPVEQAVTHWRGFVAARQGVKALTEVFRLNLHQSPVMPLPAPHRSLHVEHAAIAVPGERSVLVQGVNFHLAAGDALGIIGPSGSGKTSLIRTLVGIWPAVKGSIRLDGAELNQWDQTTLGKSIGYLPQNVELFEGTVAENISRFEPNPVSEDVLAAAGLANLHKSITSLPHGYDTMIGESGSRLSSGLCQRIGLARAIYGWPFFIVLDEPNSNLDSEGDLALREAIQKMRAYGSIVIVVAHRPSAIEPVDQLLYLRDGTQVAYGKKADVLAAALHRSTNSPNSDGVYAGNGA